MPPDWKCIRAARQDVTDWVIHWTRGQSFEGQHESAFQVLQRILWCGYLKPSFAPRWRQTAGGKSNTVQGPYPVVCYTDQPLSAFIPSCKTLSSRYSPYGLAFEKHRLFIYGGRPLVYGDKTLLDRLHDDDKYLWVRYDPVPSPSFRNYPIDWTHEREWRARVQRFSWLKWGLTPEEGVPLILPPAYINGTWIISLPRVLVQTLQEATELHEWLMGLPEYEGPNCFVRQLYDHFANLKIIPLDIVSERLEAGDCRWARLETLPWYEMLQ